MQMTPREIISFWQTEAGPDHWYDSDAALDTEITRRFQGAWEKARDGELVHWESSAEGALALLLLLDQFPRNMFRGHAQAFSTDAHARAVAERALARGYDLITPAGLRAFFYLPYMHSESMEDQNRSVVLIAERLGMDAMNYPFALAHREEISRFGRFPHRNQALGRQSTPEEQEFLEKSHQRPPKT